jgi:thioesterase domain-containing protein
MVPQRIVTLDALPLTHNGKLDRNALPVPQAHDDESSFIEPRTRTETTLAAIWKQVLGAQRISAGDDFFELGGDSLTTLRVAHLAREAGLVGFGIETLFARPRLADLAAHIDAWSACASTSIVPMNTLAAPLNVFAIHPGYGLVAEYRTLARHLDGTATVYGVQSPIYSDPTWWAASLDTLADDYARQIRQVQPQGPYRLIGWSMGGLLAVEVAHRLEAAGQSVSFIGLIDAGMQERADHDPAHAARVLQARRAVPGDEIARFWSDADEDRRKWRDLLGAQADDSATIGNVVLAIEQLKALTTNWRTRVVKAPLRLWWASESVGDALDAKTARWRACSSGDVVLAGVVDTDHPGIVRHPALLASVAGWLTS